MLPYTTVKHIR